MSEEIYGNYVLKNVPRLLSQLDRDKNSYTYGCFDRNHWHYKIRDFTSMVLQQGSLTLAQLYSNDFRDNIYYGNERIKEWAIASINFWMENQLRDGSFDEYWPNEHGYPPTVFSLYSTSETYKILYKYIFNKDDIEAALIKSCKFIAKHDEEGAQNQEIASIAALYSVYLSINEEWLSKIVEEKLKKVLERQSTEGWFSEYGGADIGYLSVSLNHLAEYYRSSRDKRAFQALKNVVDFVQYFVHPDGTVGGEYGSRNTEYFLPGGLEILAPEYPLAGAIADKLLGNLESCQNLPNSVDDRYLSHYFLHSYVSALINYQPRSRSDTPKLPFEIENCERYFEDAGSYVVNNKNYYAVFGLSKGVLKVFSKTDEIINDCGYVAEIKKGKFATTNWIDIDYKKTRDKNTFTISSKFYRVTQHRPSPLKHFLLRVASPIFGKRLIPIMKKQLITRDVVAPITFNRSVTFLDDGILIKDVIKSKTRLEKLSASDGFSLRYVPSSKYFQAKEIKRLYKEETLNNVEGVEIEKYIDILNNKLVETIDDIS